jgi:hypothetical protein
MRYVEFILSILDYGILPSEIKIGHKIKNIEIKNGQIYNGFMITEKEDADNYFKLIKIRNNRLVKFVSDEDNWEKDILINLSPNQKENYFFKVISKKSCVYCNKDYTEHLLQYYDYKHNYENCKCHNCNDIIKYEDKYCKFCGTRNLNVIPYDKYDDAIKFV